MLTVYSVINVFTIMPAFQNKTSDKLFMSLLVLN